MKTKIFVFLLLLGFSNQDEDHPRHEPPNSNFAPTGRVGNVMEGSRNFWRVNAARHIQGTLNRQFSTNKAKNIILFIGDGMSMPTVSATRMYLGKEENFLSFERFPYYGIAKHYCVDLQTGDSACTATAFLCGVKTNNRLIGINANVLSRQCAVNRTDHVDSIVKWAQNSYKATGIVTTTRITHATPAAAYAHAAHRGWENNIAISSACRNRPDVTDIAHQLIHDDPGKNLKVIMGCGRRHFLNTTMRDEEGNAGARTDGRNLIDEWITERNKQGRAEYVGLREQLMNVDLQKTDYLMGLFEADHCFYNLDIMDNNRQNLEPTLSEMTAKALRMLQKEENGFFLLVESGRIDHAHHGTAPHRALEETAEFARTIELVKQMTDESDTLLVVSADHSHVNTFNGYPVRGNHIGGVVGYNAQDGLPFSTISYTNGPGHSSTYETGTNRRVNLRNVDMKNPARQASATVPLSSETHAGDDVGVYASGPWSHLFTGTYEQNVIPLAMAYAAEIGPYGVIEEDRKMPVNPYIK